MRVQGRFGGVSAIAYMAENLAGSYFIANLHRNRAGPHMGIKGVQAVSDIHYDIVAAGIEEVDVDRDLSRMRDIFRNTVHHLNHFARRHAVDRCVVAEVTGVLILGTGPSGA